MTVDHRAAHLDQLRSLLSSVTYPIQYTVHLPIEIGQWASESLASRRELIRENTGLRRERLLTRSRLEKLAELEAENKRLRGLLDSSAKVADRVLIAEIMSVDMDPFSRRIVLNKGVNDGVATGQSIIDSNGVMGQIVNVGPFSSDAMLITDPSHALPVQVNRNGFRSIAVGTGTVSSLDLAHVPNNADVRVGDLLVTSGLGGRFPSGYPVGRVTKVARDSRQPFATVEVKPSARLERNREVLVVWSATTPVTLRTEQKSTRRGPK